MSNETRITIPENILRIADLICANPSSYDKNTLQMAGWLRDQWPSIPAPAPAAPLGAVEAAKMMASWQTDWLNDAALVIKVTKSGAVVTSGAPTERNWKIAKREVDSNLSTLPAPPAPQGIEWTGTKILDVGGHEVAFSACSGGAMAIEIISQRAAKFSQAYLGAEAIAELRKFLDLNYPATQEPAPQAAPSDLDSKPIFEALWTAARLGAEGKKEPYVIASDLMLALEFPEPSTPAREPAAPVSESGYRCHYAGNGQWFFQRGETQWALFDEPGREPAALDIREAVARQMYKDFCTGSWDAEPEWFKTQFYERVDRVLSLMTTKDPLNGSGETPSPTAPRSEIREALTPGDLDDIENRIHYAEHESDCQIEVEGVRTCTCIVSDAAAMLRQLRALLTSVSESVSKANRPNPSPSPSPVVPPVDVKEEKRNSKLEKNTWMHPAVSIKSATAGPSSTRTVRGAYGGATQAKVTTAVQNGILLPRPPRRVPAMDKATSLMGDPFEAVHPEAQPDCICGAKMVRVANYWFVYRCGKCARISTPHAWVIQSGIRARDIAEYEAKKKVGSHG